MCCGVMLLPLIMYIHIHMGARMHVCMDECVYIGIFLHLLSHYLKHTLIMALVFRHIKLGLSEDGVHLKSKLCVYITEIPMY